MNHKYYRQLEPLITKAAERARLEYVTELSPQNDAEWWEEYHKEFSKPLKVRAHTFDHPDRKDDVSRAAGSVKHKREDMYDAYRRRRWHEERGNRTRFRTGSPDRKRRRRAEWLKRVLKPTVRSTAGTLNQGIARGQMALPNQTNEKKLSEPWDIQQMDWLERLRRSDAEVRTETAENLNEGTSHSETALANHTNKRKLEDPEEVEAEEWTERLKRREAGFRRETDQISAAFLHNSDNCVTSLDLAIARSKLSLPRRW